MNQTPEQNPIKQPECCGCGCKRENDAKAVAEAPQAESKEQPA